eukprot:476431_1
MGGLLFQVGGTIVYLYVLFGVICIVGVCTFCCIKPMTLDPGQNIQSQAIDIENTEKLISAPSTSDIESTGDHSVDGSESVEATNGVHCHFLCIMGCNNHLIMQSFHF